MAIFFAAAVWPSAKTYRRVAVAAASIAVFLALTATAGVVFYQPCVENDTVAGTLGNFRSGAGFMGTAEYAPLGADNYELATSLPAACLVTEADKPLGIVPEGADPDAAIPAWNAAQGSCDATLSWQLDQPRHKRLTTFIRDKDYVFQNQLKFTNNAHAPSHPNFLILRLRSYPAWRVAINGYPVASLPTRKDGLIAVPVWPGSIVLTVDWTTSPDVVAGRTLCALAVLLFTGLCLLERKLRCSHLS
jgi:hypothetical protein